MNFWLNLILVEHSQTSKFSLFLKLTCINFSNDAPFTASPSYTGTHSGRFRPYKSDVQIFHPRLPLFSNCSSILNSILPEIPTQIPILPANFSVSAQRLPANIPIYLWYVRHRLHLHSPTPSSHFQRRCRSDLARNQMKNRLFLPSPFPLYRRLSNAT